jgi:hypothetical protein
MSLALDIDSLPLERAEAAITRLEALKTQRAAENRLAHYVPYPKQRAFMKPAPSTVSACSCAQTVLAKPCAAQPSWRFT